MRRNLLTFLVLVGGACLVLGTMTAAATAHETTAAGGYDLVVGWGTEPAYVGQQNSVQIEISERGSGRPFVKLGDSLGVTIIYGDQKKEMALTPEFDLAENVGTPGDYRAWFFPTAPGDYTFRFTGKIGSQCRTSRNSPPRASHNSPPGLMRLFYAFRPPFSSAGPCPGRRLGR